MVPPPRDPWYRRSWAYYNRPYPGFGCLYTVVLIFFIWLIVSLLFRPLWFW